MAQISVRNSYLLALENLLISKCVGDVRLKAVEDLKNLTLKEQGLEDFEAAFADGKGNGWDADHIFEAQVLTSYFDRIRTQQYVFYVRFKRALESRPEASKTFRATSQYNMRSLTKNEKVLDKLKRELNDAKNIIPLDKSLTLMKGILFGVSVLIPLVRCYLKHVVKGKYQSSNEADIHKNIQQI